MQAEQIPPQASVPKVPRPRRYPRRKDRTQALAIQRILTATILDPKTEPASRASCAAAWSRVQEARRVIEGKPLPGQLRPDLAQASAAKRLGPPARVAQRIAIVPKPAEPVPTQPAEPADTQALPGT